MVETTIASVESVGQRTVAVEFDTPPGFQAFPGQFVLIRADISGDEETSYYTLSSVNVHGTFEITAAVEPDGDLGPWLAERDAGDTVVVKGPFGEIQYTGDGDVCVLASGPGIGPAIGIAERAIRNGYGATVVFHGADPPHADRLEQLAEAGATIDILTDTDGIAERLADIDSDAGVFVFGFAAFVEAVTDALDRAGIDRGDVEIENFGPK